MHIEPFDARTADDAMADAFAANLHESRLATVPRGEREPTAYTLNRIRNVGSIHQLRYWIARTGDDVAGSIEVEWFEAPDNRDRSFVSVDVAPARYSEDLVAALLRPAVASLRELGRPILTVYAAEGDPLGKYVESRGGKRGSVEQFNVTRLASLDPADLASLARVPAGYELVAFDGPCPDDLLEAYTRMVSTMNTAPRDDLTMEDWVYTPERVRDYEAGLAARGHDLWTVCAREIGSTEFAAFTNVVIAPEWPEVVHQEDTAVAVPHRGRGLGFAVKATNLLRLVTERPEARCVSTWNAASNSHMLRVNRRLGFECEHQFEAYEVHADQLEPQPA